jgi:hypothetical protein
MDKITRKRAIFNIQNKYIKKGKRNEKNVQMSFTRNKYMGR